MPHLPRPETLPAQAERRRSQRTHVVTSVTVAWHTTPTRASSFDQARKTTLAGLELGNQKADLLPGRPKNPFVTDSVSG